MKIILPIACFLLSAACSTNQKTKGQWIIVTNRSGAAVTDKPVIVPRKDFPILGSHLYPILINQRGDTIPSQLDHSAADKLWNELFFVITLAPGRTDSISLTWTETAPKYPPRTNIRFGVRQTVRSTIDPAMSDTFYADQLPGVIGYQHYQTDGPTWENDRIAFRQYLDGRNSIDVFGKTKPAMTPDSVGIGKDGKTENNYSEMKDWGMDVLAVANSAGIGGFSLMIKDSLPRLGIIEGDSVNNIDSTILNILAKGPVRSTLQVRYLNWKALDRIYAAEQTTSTWPGMYAFKNSVSFDHLKGDETMVVSLVNSNTQQKLSELKDGNDWVILYTHDKQSVNKTSILGLALVLPKKNYVGFFEAPKTGRLSNAFLAKLRIQENQPIEYYAVAAWEGSDVRFADSAYFKNYLADFAGQLSAQLTVTIR